MRHRRSDSTLSKPSEADEVSAPTLEVEDTSRTPEENKNPAKKISDHSEKARRSTASGSFTPPPALSPAYSLAEETKGEEESEVKMEVESDEEEKPSRSDSPKKSMKKEMEVNGQIVAKREKMKYKKRGEKEKVVIPFLDPNAPKRNRSAYVHFIIHRRASYSKAVMSQRDINIALAADWQKLTAEERKPFQKKAEEEKEKFLELMEDYKKTDSHTEFQKKRAKLLANKGNSSNQRKRRHESDSEGDHEDSHRMAFPPTSSFCPLLNTTSSEGPSTASSSLQYSGPIFTPEFVTYNKTRDTYRRQLAIERSNVEHELEALHHHDTENRIRRQEQRIGKVDEKIEETMDKMRLVFGGIPGAKDHLSSVESLTEWLETLTHSAARDSTRKSVKEAINKNSKAIVALRK